MITGELKSKVDRIWDTMCSGGISNPLSVIEQLTYLLFIKRLDELHTLKARKAARIGKPIEEPIFTAGQDKLRWSRFKDAAPEQMFITVRDEVFPFIKTLGQKGETDGEGGSTYTHHMKDALFMMPTPRVLANVVDQLDAIDMADQDTKAEIAANDDDLSINRYQEVTYEAEGRRWPARSMRKRSGITCVAIWTTS
jgi:type I restriction enzyme M protein